jgi:hypothetical protein
MAEKKKKSKGYAEALKSIFKTPASIAKGEGKKGKKKENKKLKAISRSFRKK